MSDYFMQTESGGIFIYGEVDPERQTGVNLEDIATGLTNKNRFNGMSTLPYSICAHSLGVEDLVLQLVQHKPEVLTAEEGTTICLLRLHALLHDAHEVYSGDMVQPFKEYLRKVMGWDVRVVEDDITATIYKCLDVPLPNPYETTIIRGLDLLALKIERMRFMPSNIKWSVDDIEIPSWAHYEPTVFTKQGRKHLRSVYLDRLECAIRKVR